MKIITKDNASRKKKCLGWAVKMRVPDEGKEKESNSTQRAQLSFAATKIGARWTGRNTQGKKVLK